MTRQAPYGRRATDFVSALFLLLAFALTGGNPLLSGQSVPASPLQSSASGTAGHRSAPVVAKQQLFVIEARAAKASSWDDGNANPLLAADGFELSAPVGDPLPHSAGLASVSAFAAASFQARAPPALS